MTTGSSRLTPFRLAPWFSQRPWGRRDLRPWYSTTGTTEPVGEAWLTGPQCVVETGALAGQTLASLAASAGQRLLGADLPGANQPDTARPVQPAAAEFPLLVKLLFPSQKLSLQVHPDDAMAQAMGQPRGKTECWHVLEAEPGATLALGLRPGVTAEAVRAAVSGPTQAGRSMEDLMQPIPVSAGETIFVDAGTIHSIGPGMVLLEVQQTSDLTFRLYDYGRPRELHLEQGLRAMKTQTAAGKVQPVAMKGFTRLIRQRYFVLDRYHLAVGEEALIPADRPGCLVGLDGAAMVLSGTGDSGGAGESGDPTDSVELLPGRAVVVPVGAEPVLLRGSATAPGATLVHCWAPDDAP